MHAVNNLTIAEQSSSRWPVSLQRNWTEFPMLSCEMRDKQLLTHTHTRLENVKRTKYYILHAGKILYLHREIIFLLIPKMRLHTLTRRGDFLI